jgi:BirA family biotin operon repressor/biotin-[acetyl-CoA-carboxylase] ligase
MTPREEWHLDALHLGRRVLVFDEVDSTNTRAALLADNTANDGLAILANSQTAGRGQYQRQWLCQPGAGMLLSVLLFPPAEVRRPSILTAWAAVSVCELIREAAALEASLKWPNDVFIQGRKICGILIEQARGTVVGLGLNVNQSPQSLLELGLTEAGSLAGFAGRSFDVADLACRLLQRLDYEYALLCRGDFGSLTRRWRERLCLLGRPALVQCADASYSGMLVELTFECVQLQLPTGGTVRLPPEVVKHILTR